MNLINKIYKKNEEIINYIIIGILTTLISLLTYYICVKTFLNPSKAIELQIANIISWITGVSFAYITNRKYVFKSKNEQISKEITTFITSRILTLLIDMFLMYILVTSLNINDKISKLTVQIIIIILNYIFSKLYVFKNKKWQIKIKPIKWTIKIHFVVFYYFFINNKRKFMILCF